MGYWPFLNFLDNNGKSFRWMSASYISFFDFFFHFNTNNGVELAWTGQADEAATLGGAAARYAVLQNSVANLVHRRCRFLGPMVGADLGFFSQNEESRRSFGVRRDPQQMIWTPNYPRIDRGILVSQRDNNREEQSLFLESTP